MKKIYLTIVIFALVFVGCDNTQRKAQKLIEAHLTETISKDEGYEPVKFSELDSLYTSPFDDSKFVEIYDKFKAYADKSQEALKARESYKSLTEAWAVSRRNVLLSEARQYQDSAEVFKPAIDSISENFVPEFNGWTMLHSYRTKSLTGGMDVKQLRFYFDKNLESVVDSEEVDIAVE